jgi:hypothetical protein
MIAMKIRKTTNVQRAIWSRLPPLAQWALVARYGAVGNVPLRVLLP